MNAWIVLALAIVVYSSYKVKSVQNKAVADALIIFLMILLFSIAAKL